MAIFEQIVVDDPAERIVDLAIANHAVIQAVIVSARMIFGRDEVNLVVAALGRPRYKKVDASGAQPVEKWHYDLPDNKTRVITFQNGKVLMVEEF